MQAEAINTALQNFHSYGTKTLRNVSFQVVTAVTANSAISCEVTLSSLVEVC
jgi:hypothetical protein